MKRRRFLILSGPTREYLDPVRYLTNGSSGRQGIALAAEASARGHRVELIQGPVTEVPPRGVHVISVVSADEMLEKARSCHGRCDVLIGAAAVSDFRPSRRKDTKRKRQEGTWTLELVPNRDILAELGRNKERRVHVGFALETEDLVRNARRKLAAKNLDWIVANSPDAIDAERSRYILLGADGTERDLGELSKENLAREILDVVE